jgi:hypothetical protein
MELPRETIRSYATVFARVNILFEDTIREFQHILFETALFSILGLPQIVRRFDSVPLTMSVAML